MNDPVSRAVVRLRRRHHQRVSGHETCRECGWCFDCNATITGAQAYEMNQLQERKHHD